MPQTLWDSSQNSCQDKYGEVGGENPEQVGESDAWGFFCYQKKMGFSYYTAT